MKLYWVRNGLETGANFGYSIHSKKLKESCAAAGVEITVDPAADYDAAVHVTFPANFRAIPGRKNIAFIQTEISDVKEPDVWRDNISKADILVTSCTHSRDVEAKHYHGPIEVCPLGVDPERFPYTRRREPSNQEPFHFLWFNNLYCGKGDDLIMLAWQKWQFSGRMPPNVDLYMKGSGMPDGECEVLPWNRMTTDTRYFPAQLVTELYNWAHAFVSTSFGDAWGLTLSDAMASGLPCIWTHWSAPVDYADEKIGYPVTNFEMSPFWRSREEAFRPGVEPVGYGAKANEYSIIERMEGIYYSYPEALRRGRAASKRMHSRFTWRQAAERFIEICEGVIH
jgi:glycosyltransferase involved in cell wall biosynthesis